MKMNKILMGLAVLAGGLFASCDTDNEAAVYNVYTPNVSFVDGTTSVTTPESSVEVKVTLTRFGSNGDLTVHYTGSSEDAGIFTDLSSGEATFANGSTTTTVTIKAENLVKGQEYTYTLKLDDESVATADTIVGNPITVAEVVVMCDYNWISAGTCTFIDYNFSDGEAIQGVKVENGEGSNVYRIVDAYGKDTGNITFILNSDGTIQLKDGKHCAYSGYAVYYDSVNYGAYCYVENEGNHYVVNHLLVAGSSLYIGGFDFIWDKE